MSQIKALQILSGLTKDEFNKFGQFIVSPYFNRSKDLNKLYNFLKPLYPDFDKAKIDSKKIYKKLYPGKVYNEGTIRNLFSGFGKLSERYLSFCVYEDCFFYQYNLLIEMNDRGLNNLFEKKFNEYHNEISKSPDVTGQKSLYMFLIEQEMLSNIVRRNADYKTNYQNSSSLSLLVHLLKTFFRRHGSNASLENNFNAGEEYNVVAEFFKKTDVESLIGYIKKNKGEQSLTLNLEYLLYL